MTLGEVISEYRTSHKLSMDGFAAISGLSKAYISMLEKNRTQRGDAPVPSIDTYNKVAQAIGVATDELIRMVDDNISLDSARSVGSTVEISDLNSEFISLFHRLDEQDQQRILGRMEEMLESEKYQKVIPSKEA